MPTLNLNPLVSILFCTSVHWPLARRLTRPMRGTRRLQVNATCVQMSSFCRPSVQHVILVRPGEAFHCTLDPSQHAKMLFLFLVLALLFKLVYLVISLVPLQTRTWLSKARLVWRWPWWPLARLAYHWHHHHHHRDYYCWHHHHHHDSGDL